MVKQTRGSWELTAEDKRALPSRATRVVVWKAAQRKLARDTLAWLARFKAEMTPEEWASLSLVILQLCLRWEQGGLIDLGDQT